MIHTMILHTVTNMEDYEFLELLKESGFTPNFYVNEQHDIDYCYEEYDFEIVQELITKIKKLENQKHVIRYVPGYNYEYSSEINTLDNEIYKLEEQLIATILNCAGKFEVVEEVGGGEGDGEHYNLVLYFADFDKYVRTDGNYLSYEGIDNLSDWYIVTPKEKTIIVYEPVGTKDNIYPV